MTREEAIKMLIHTKEFLMGDKICWSKYDCHIKAIDMAIEALTEPINCVKCKHYYETEDDTDVHGHCRMDTAHTMKREEAIKKLQKQKAEYLEEWVDYSGVAEAYDMAIEALKQPFDAMQLLNDGTLKVKVTNVLDIKRVMVMDDNIIYDSYYPDRPKGEWIKNDDFICSECGYHMIVGDGTYNFCPNCGSDMRRQ